MKRKIFSKLLMGALLVASVSSFTSCKDYDDDINSLKESVAKAALQSNLDALTTQVNGIKTTADQALTTANAAATKSELSAAKSEAMTEAAKGIANAATAQEAADAAKTLAQEAKTAAESIDLSPYAKTTDVEAMRDAAITTIQSALEDYWKAAKIQEELAKIQAQVDKALTAEDIEELTTKVNNAIKGVDAIWSAITNISLVKSFSSQYIQTGTNQQGQPVYTEVAQVNGETWLNFYTGIVPANFTFGKAEKKVANSYVYTATPNVVYTKDDNYNITQYVVVRVSPASADLKTAKLKLMNAWNNDLLEKYIDIVSVEPNNDAITRAGSVSGLWKIGFELKKGIRKADFDAASALYADNNHTTRQKFAIAANNTVSQDAERFAISEYSLMPWANNYQGATIDELRTDAVIYSDVDGNPRYSQYILNQLSDRDRARNNNNRHVLKATVGGKIYIDLSKVRYWYNGGVSAIDKFYVVLDDDNANTGTGAGDASSEYNAWHSYTYSGLNTMFNAADGPAEISVTKMLMAGDEISFRIFAVNYDGTLVDADGEPFSVMVSNPLAGATVTADFTAIKQNNFVAGVFAVTGTLSDAATWPYGTAGTDAATATTAVLNNSQEISYLLCSKADGTAAKKWSAVKYIKVTIPASATAPNLADMTQWVDNTAGSFTITADNGTTHVTENVLTVSLTKKLPETFPTAFDWIRPTELVGGVYTCFPAPTANENAASWTANATANGYKKLTGVFKGLDESKDAVGNVLEKNYQFTFKGAGLDANGNADNFVVTYSTSKLGRAKGVTDPTTNYQLIARAGLLDNSTEYDTEVSYVYKKVSSATAYDGSPLPDVTVAGPTFKTKFADALDTDFQSFAWSPAKSIATDGTVTEYATNEITYNSSQTVYYLDCEYIVGTNNSTWMSTFSSNITEPVKGAALAWRTITNSYWTTANDNLHYKLNGNTPGNTTFSVTGTDLFKSVAIDVFPTNAPAWFIAGTNGRAIKFTVRDDVAGNEPSATINATLVIKAKDSFGRTHEYSVPIVINPHH